MTINRCKCGKPMSFFEIENYKQCGGCHLKEYKEKRVKEIEKHKRKKEDK
ncbi:hypothetical protein HXA34_20025 [Salipaludibacillus agaradhaerens]|jgi:hypothetical protein|nr:hypothetical protein [Salipaludibacillus agaradhaerens]MCR6108579.1 hypothetical protein [Salipaludibacillus agaradhaerens]MCR6120608.1 hypothetical protein [Salipaludibacillus agaradhaerens]